MTQYVQSFFRKNLYQIIIGIILLGSNLLSIYISFQLFQQSTNFKVAAVQSDVTDIKQSIHDLTDISAKIDVVNTKLDAISDRQDRQGNAISDLQHLFIDGK